MNEDEARDWLVARFGQTRFAKLERYVAFLLSEAEHQSLIARSTFADIWTRHIVDCAQLTLLSAASGTWLDVGSGGGLPGIVIAIIRDAPLVMFEPRRGRASFLHQTIEDLVLPNASLIAGPVQGNAEIASTISARAVAPLDNLFAWTEASVSRETVYLLPRGQSCQGDLVMARRSWQGRFHVEQSITDPAAGIVVAREVTRR